MLNRIKKLIRLLRVLDQFEITSVQQSIIVRHCSGTCFSIINGNLEITCLGIIRTSSEYLLLNDDGTFDPSTYNPNDAYPISTCEIGEEFKDALAGKS